MLVPKETVHEDDLLAWSRDEVGVPRQILPVEPVPIAKRMQHPANDTFRLDVLAPNASQLLASLTRAKRIQID